MERARIEKTKAGFDRSGLLAAREKSLEALRRVAAAISPGMTEEEAYEAAKIVFADMGAEKHWHRTWIRFGANTLKTYGVLSEPKTKLGGDDIFFVDIGPVWDGYEGDAGDTFTTGADAEKNRCREDARRLFDLVARRWRTEGETGQKLYEFAAEQARKLGWELNLTAGGHRLSDFPHALYFKGRMADVPFPPSEHLWVLEIQIRHPARDFGAFYEDLLFSASS